MDDAMMSACNHTITQGREGKPPGCGWCVNCGEQVYEVETRQCAGCVRAVQLPGGMICDRHLMAIPPGMLVTFKVKDGTCWSARA